MDPSAGAKWLGSVVLALEGFEQPHYDALHALETVPAMGSQSP
jgi:hypothetical protein